MVPAVFLDRDGTINVEKNYVHKPEDFEFEEGAIEAIAQLNRAGYKIIVVTNQAGVARGYYTEHDVAKLHCWINEELSKYNARIDKFYYCPHHFDYGIGSYKVKCSCRKPDILLIQQAIGEFDIDVSKSFFIGDRETDIYAGLASGLQPILVLTGYGSKVLGQLSGLNIKHAINLSEAVSKYILK